MQNVESYEGNEPTSHGIAQATRKPQAVANNGSHLKNMDAILRLERCRFSRCNPVGGILAPSSTRTAVCVCSLLNVEGGLNNDVVNDEEE